MSNLNKYLSTLNADIPNSDIPTISNKQLSTKDAQITASALRSKSYNDYVSKTLAEGKKPISLADFNSGI